MKFASEVVCVVQCPRSEERKKVPFTSPFVEMNAGRRNGTVHGMMQFHGWVSNVVLPRIRGDHTLLLFCDSDSNRYGKDLGFVHCRAVIAHKVPILMYTNNNSTHFFTSITNTTGSQDINCTVCICSCSLVRK